MDSSRACPVCEQPVPEGFTACPFDGTPFGATRPRVDPRIDRLRQQLERSDRSDREAGLSLLNRQKLAVTHASSAADRAAIAQKVEQAEQQYRAR